MIRRIASAALAAAIMFVVSMPAFAQATPPQVPATPPPPPVWKADAGAGLAFTSGNSDTSTVNASYDFTYDPHQTNIIKSDGVLLRGSTNGTLAAERAQLDGRDEYALTGRIGVFGQTQYVRDAFKEIVYLIAPTGGVSLTIAKSKPTQCEVTFGAGGVWEKDTGLSVAASGAVTLGETFAQQLTKTTTFAESFSGLWKTTDWSDSLYTSSVSVGASMSTHTQLKVELDDTFKNKPPVAVLHRNDISMLVAFVFKI